MIQKLRWLRMENKDLQQRVKEIDEKIEELTILGSSTISNTPHSSMPGNPIEKYVTKLIALRDKRQLLIFKSLEIESETEEYIKNITDPEIRTLMRKYYIDGMSWNEIARIFYTKNCDGSTPRKKVTQYLRNK